MRRAVTEVTETLDPSFVAREAARRKVWTYLALTLALSSIFYALIISAGTLAVHGGLYVLALMWSPGVAALMTRLIHQRNL